MSINELKKCRWTWRGGGGIDSKVVSDIPMLKTEREERGHRVSREGQPAAPPSFDPILELLGYIELLVIACAFGNLKRCVEIMQDVNQHALNGFKH